MNLQNRKRLTDFKKELIVARYEDGTEKAMAPHSSTYAWKVPWTEEPGRLQSMGSLESDTTERLHFHFSLSCIREGNGNPLQCSCLENPRDGGAWWAAVYGVAHSRTRVKRLSSSSSNTYKQSHSKVLGVRTFQHRNLKGTQSAHNNDQMIRYDRANGVCYIDLYAALYA